MKDYIIHLILESASYFPAAAFCFLTAFGAFVCYNAYGWVGVRNMAIVYLLMFVFQVLCVGAIEFCVWLFTR